MGHATSSWHVELDKLPILNEEIERKSPKSLVVKLDAFENDWFKSHFSIDHMQMKLNEINKIDFFFFF